MHKSSRRPSALHNGQKNWGGNREDLHKKCFLPGRFSLARRMIVLKVLNNGNAAPMLFPRLLLFASPPSTPSHHKAVSMISFLTEALVQIQIEKIDQIK